jgi:hypothetical protein
MAGLIGTWYFVRAIVIVLAAASCCCGQTAGLVLYDHIDETQFVDLPPRAAMLCTYYQPIEWEDLGINGANREWRWIMNGEALVGAGATWSCPMFVASGFPGSGVETVTFYLTSGTGQYYGGADIGVPEYMDGFCDLDGSTPVLAVSWRGNMGGTYDDDEEPYYSHWKRESGSGQPFAKFVTRFEPTATGFRLYADPRHYMSMVGTTSDPISPGSGTWQYDAELDGAEYLWLEYEVGTDPMFGMGGGGCPECCEAIEAMAADTALIQADVNAIMLDVDGWREDWDVQDSYMRANFLDHDPGADLDAIRLSAAAIQTVLGSLAGVVDDTMENSLDGLNTKLTTINTTLTTGGATVHTTPTWGEQTGTELVEEGTDGLLAEHTFEAPEFDHTGPDLDAFEFVFPLSDIGAPLGVDMADISLTADFSFFASYRDILRTIILAGTSLWGMGRVWAEFRRV